MKYIHKEKIWQKKEQKYISHIDKLKTVIINLQANTIK